MSRIMFDGLAADEKYCDKDCPRLQKTTAGIPESVHKGYSGARNYVCQFFGPLGKPQDGPGFELRRPERAQECIDEGTRVATPREVDKVVGDAWGRR